MYKLIRMKLLIDDTTGRKHGLNANEMSVYEAIGKCSRKDDARGWYADMQALADQLPHRIGRMTVSRAVDKLLTLGLVRRDGKSLFAVQIAQENVQNAQNPTPPLYPPINNKRNGKREYVHARAYARSGKK